jgi:hypothetical protein
MNGDGGQKLRSCSSDASFSNLMLALESSNINGKFYEKFGSKATFLRPHKG